MKRATIFSLTLLASTAFSMPAALAVVGGVGASPPPGSDAPATSGSGTTTQDSGTTQPTDTDAAAQQPSGTDAASGKVSEPDPNLSIDFGKNYVNDDRAIHDLVHGTGSTSAGATYVIVSKVPTGGTREQNSRNTIDYTGNLNDVVQKLQDEGVPTDRIQVRTETSDSVTGQQVQFFVK